MNSLIKKYFLYISFSALLCFPSFGSNVLSTDTISTDYHLLLLDNDSYKLVSTEKQEANGSVKDYTVWMVPGTEHDTCGIWCRGEFGDDSWNYGAISPTGDTAFQLNRSKLIIDESTTAWGGWMTAMFDFGADKPLPSAEMEYLRNGNRVLAMDVYFEERDAIHTFQEMYEYIQTGDNLKYPLGIKFQLRLGKEAFFNTGGNEWFAVKESYLNRPGEWQTLYFSQDDQGEPNFTYNTGIDEVDRFMLIPAYAYPYGESNYFYIRNIRITDPIPDTAAPEFMLNYPRVIQKGGTYSLASFRINEPGTVYTMMQPNDLPEPTIADVIRNDSVSIPGLTDSSVVLYSGLTPLQAYTLYIITKDTLAEPNYSDMISLDFSTNDQDNSPPLFAGNTPLLANQSASKVTVRVKTNEPAIVSYMLKEASEPAPSTLDFTNHDSLVIFDPTSEYLTTFSGLKNETDYILYFLARDLETPSNVMTETVNLAFSTENMNHLPDISLHNPLVINKGGVYEKLKVNSTNYDVPAITISTDEPVTIKQCVISGTGDLVVNTKNKAKIILHDNYIWGRNPDIIDKQQGRSVLTTDADYFIFKNNYTNQTGGIRVGGFTGQGDLSVIIENNIHVDLTSLVSNGTGKEGRLGYNLEKDNGGQWNRQMVILRDVNVPQGTPAPRIMYNFMENNEYKPDNVSSTEDLINNFGSIGPDTLNPIIIARNFLRGAHGNKPFDPYKPFTGSCIIMDASAASGADFGNVRVYENFLSYCQNTGIGISSGHHVKVYNNKIINPLHGEDGEQISGFYGNAAYLWAWKDDRPVRDCEFFNNTVHNFKSKEQDPGSKLSRNDLWLPDCFGTNNCFDNLKVSETLNHDAIEEMYCEFYAMLQDENKTIGPDWGPGMDLIDFDFQGCVLDTSVNGINAVEKPLDNNSYILFPNPTTDELTIKFMTNTSGYLTISSIDGIILFQEPVKDKPSEFQVDVSGMPRGMKIVTLHNIESTVNKKILLK